MASALRVAMMDVRIQARRSLTKVRRRILTDEQLKDFDNDVWENYPHEGTYALANRWSVEPIYVMKRAARIGADRHGTHLLTMGDKMLIVGLIREGLDNRQIAEKFEVRPFAIQLIRNRLPENRRQIAEEAGNE